jgi:hypothetical protein
MKSRQAYFAIRAAILRRQDLRYRGAAPPGPDFFEGNPYRGFCYIATKAFCELVDNARPWCDDSGMHYWAMIGDERWDLTAEQFDSPEYLEAIYSRGRATKYKGVCKRTAELLAETARGSTAAA